MAIIKLPNPWKGENLYEKKRQRLYSWTCIHTKHSFHRLYTTTQTSAQNVQIQIAKMRFRFAQIFLLLRFSPVLSSCVYVEQYRLTSQILHIPSKILQTYSDIVRQPFTVWMMISFIFLFSKTFDAMAVFFAAITMLTLPFFPNQSVWSVWVQHQSAIDHCKFTKNIKKIG